VIVVQQLREPPTPYKAGLRTHFVASRLVVPLILPRQRGPTELCRHDIATLAVAAGFTRRSLSRRPSRVAVREMSSTPESFQPRLKFFAILGARELRSGSSPCC
jgi:hypothetical protein